MMGVVGSRTSWGLPPLVRATRMAGTVCTSRRSLCGEGLYQVIRAHDEKLLGTVTKVGSVWRATLLSGATLEPTKTREALVEEMLIDSLAP